MSKDEKQKAGKKGFYHRYFEDYQELKVPRGGGRGFRIQRTYVGPLYEAKLTGAQRVGRGFGYALLYLGALALVLCSAMQPVPANVRWFNGLATGIVLILFVLLLVPLGSLVTSKKKMTVYEYKSGSVRTLQLVKWVARALFLAAALYAVSSLVYRSGQLAAELLCAAGFALAGLLLEALRRIEARIPYDCSQDAAKNPPKQNQD